MSRAWWIGAVLLLGAASAVLLPQLADLDAGLRRGPGVVETFSGGRPGILDESNLVDKLGALPLELQIGSAGWRNNVLSIDLKVTGNDNEPGEICRDMAEVMSFAFKDTGNVDQLLLRIIAEDKWLGSRRLLLAADIRRPEWSLQLQHELAAAGNAPLSEILRTRFRISESDLWKKQFITP